MPGYPDDPAKSASPLFGTLKVIIMIAVLAIAALAILMVAEVIPRDAFNDLLTKVTLIFGIIAGVSVVFALLMRTK